MFSLLIEILVNMFLIYFNFQAGIINDDIVKKMPSRGRKRFVSEGDGGLIKDSSFWWLDSICGYQKFMLCWGILFEQFAFTSDQYYWLLLLGWKWKLILLSLRSFATILLNFPPARQYCGHPCFICAILVYYCLKWKRIGKIISSTHNSYFMRRKNHKFFSWN